MSETTKFTDGPWVVDRGEIIAPGAAYILKDFGHDGFAWVDWDRVTPDAMQANWALIAAAPDMYAILDAFVHTPAQQPSRFAELQQEAKAILASARGDASQRTDDTNKST